MKKFFGGKILLSLAIAAILAASVPACQARSGSKAEKHAQKMQKQISKHKPGALLHLEFNDNTECSAKLMTVSDTSFTINNVETNAVETHNYSDVVLVEKGQAYIGKGSTSKKRGHIF